MHVYAVTCCVSKWLWHKSRSRPMPPGDLSVDALVQRGIVGNLQRITVTAVNFDCPAPYSALDDSTSITAPAKASRISLSTVSSAKLSVSELYWICDCNGFQSSSQTKNSNSAAATDSKFTAFQRVICWSSTVRGASGCGVPCASTATQNTRT